MRVFLLIAVSSVVALLVDWYIYRRVISRHNFGRIWKIGYLVYAFIVDTMVVSALIAYRSAADSEKTFMLGTVMWVIAFFFLNHIPKLVYAVVSLGDYIVQGCRKRGICHIFGYTGTGLAIVAAGIILHGMTYGRSEIRVERIELELAELPESFDGLRIVQFSDTHIGTLVNAERFLERMVDSVNSLDPHIVINSGDLVNTHAAELTPQIITTLAGIRAQYGVFAVLGNHDLGIYISDTVRKPVQATIDAVTASQENMGWKVLRNDSAFITNGADSILISGFDYPRDLTLNSHSPLQGGADIAGTYEGIGGNYFNIAISHAPQLWDDIRDYGRASLTVAGHVHSMQIKFRLGNWTWSPARLFYDRWSGLYGEGGEYLYINDGIGYVMFPMRIGTKPEITLFTLRKRQG